MDSKTFLSQKLEAHAYEELVELALNILNTVKQIPDGNFEEFKESPYEETIYTEGADSFFKAKSIIEKHYNNYTSSLIHFKVLNLLKEKYSKESYATKINLISSLFDDLLDKHRTPVVDSKAYIINRIVDYNTQFLKDLNNKIFFNDKIVLAKILLDSEYEIAEANEENLSDLKNDPSDYDYNFLDENDRHCSLCENSPCICSDPQHNQ